MLRLEHISKRYQYQKVLDDISMELPEVGLVCIVGPSGCGKSTLLSIIGGIDKDYIGKVYYQDKDIKHQIHRYRRQHVSFIFQQLHLIMWLNVHINIRLSNYFHPQAKYKQKLDILEFEHLKLKSLSLGQRQRIGYLRAVFHHKDILLCDEPTGSLDPYNAKMIMEQLYQESKHRLVLIVSHDIELVKKYSHEIYEMKDGKIIEHHILKETPLPIKKEITPKRKLFSHIQLSLYSLLSHKKRTLQLIFGVSISILCILITFTLSRQLEKQIQNYLYSVIPPSSISFQSQNKQTLTLNIANELSQREDIERVQLYLDEYELLGIGFIEEHYQESQTLFIGDDSSPYTQLSLKLGRYPTQKEEILVSYSTAQHLCQSSDVSSIIGKKIYAWYKYQNQVQAIAYHVVGVSQNTTVVDTIYQIENAYIEMLQEVYGFETFESHLGIIYVKANQQRSEVITSLKQAFPLYQFIESGVSTSQNISQTMNQVEMVLLLFSILAILSSLFLIGEVMFLNVIQKKKDYAIMVCFGAKMRNLIQLVLYESFEILILSWIIVIVLYYQFLKIAEQFMIEMFNNQTMSFIFDYDFIFIVFLASCLLVLLSQLLPIIYMMKMNTVETLKE